MIAEESQQLRNISNKDRAPVEFEEMAIEASVSFLSLFKAVGLVQLNKRESDT
jgi:hypothetical protein